MGREYGKPYTCVIKPEQRRREPHAAAEKKEFMFGRLRLLWAVLMVLGASIAGKAQKYSNEFLTIGVGARAHGMGTAVAATVGDVTAGLWNPAGLAQIDTAEGLQLGAMHAEWFAGVSKFDYLGFTPPLGNGARLGFSLVRFGIDGIPNTLSLYNSDGTVNFDQVTEFSAADYAFLVSYAKPLKVKKGELLAGGSVKVIHRRIGPFANSWGFGLDAGLQYHIKGWSFGLVAKDITSTFNAWSFSFTEVEKETLALTNNEVPINSVEITRPQVVLGAARRFAVKNIGLTPEVNFILTTDGQRNTLVSADPVSMDLAGGVEADYKNFLFLRAGVSQFQQFTDFEGSEQLRMRPSLGVGFRISKFVVDYAYTDLGSEESTYSHIISLHLAIRPKDSR